MSDELKPAEPAAPLTDATLASDAEREATVARLGEAASEGRLVLDEFSERVSRAYAARTRGDLNQLVRDLPPSSETSQTPPSYRSSPSTGHTEWHIAPIGGFKREGHWRMEQQIVSISLLGGMKLDLREAEFSAPEVTLTRFSLLGGTRLAVPSGVRVDVTSFSLIGGRRIDVDERLPPNAPTLHLRAFCLVGGVRVQRTLRRERRRARRRERAR
jgi:DUF1707 SHOCT-like domain